MKDAGESLRIARNALSGVATRLVMLAIGFCLTPFVVHALGLQRYGMWAVAGSLAGYLGLLDFGLGGVFVKFLTEYTERDEFARARQVATFGMVFYLVFGLVLAGPVLLAAPAIVHLFKMPADQYANAVQVFDALFALLIASMVLGVPGAAVVARHRMDLASRNGFISYLAYAAGTVAFVRLGWGVWGVVAAQAAQVFVGSALQWRTAGRVFGPLWHHPLRIEPAIVRRMLGFGGWTQATSLLNIVGLDVGRFISASAVGVVSVSYYELGSKLAFFSKSMPSYVIDAIMPSAAAADARRDDARLDRLYADGTIYVLCATFAIGGFLSGSADAAIRVWLGERFPYVAAIIAWLTVGYAASGLAAVGTTIMRASGNARIETTFTAISAAVNLVATALLVTRFGIVGVAAGTALGWIAGSAVFVTRFHRLRGTTWWPQVGSRAVRLAVAAAIASWALAAVIARPGITHWFDRRIEGVAVLAILGVGYLAVYGVLTLALGTWRDDDLRRLRTLLHGVRVRARLPVAEAA